MNNDLKSVDKSKFKLTVGDQVNPLWMVLIKA